MLSHLVCQRVDNPQFSVGRVGEADLGEFFLLHPIDNPGDTAGLVSFSFAVHLPSLVISREPWDSFTVYTGLP